MTLHSRLPVALVLILLSHAGFAFGQSPPATSPATAPDRADAAPKWAVGVSVYQYLLPDETDYVQPTVTADRGWLHLEARYNYEDLKSGSAWFGWNFSGGETVEWSFTPMVGGAFGNTKGTAPGFKGSLAWKTLQVYSEGEYFFDAHDRSNRFWYSWSEAALSLTGWFRVGAVEQRTHMYRGDREVNRGAFVGFTRGTWDVACYVLDPTAVRPGVVLAVSAGF